MQQQQNEHDAMSGDGEQVEQSHHLDRDGDTPMTTAPLAQAKGSPQGYGKQEKKQMSAYRKELGPVPGRKHRKGTTGEKPKATQFAQKSLPELDGALAWFQDKYLNEDTGLLDGDVAEKVTQLAKDFVTKAEEFFFGAKNQPLPDAKVLSMTRQLYNELQKELPDNQDSQDARTQFLSQFVKEIERFEAADEDNKHWKEATATSNKKLDLGDQQRAAAALDAKLASLRLQHVSGGEARAPPHDQSLGDRQSARILALLGYAHWLDTASNSESGAFEHTPPTLAVLKILYAAHGPGVQTADVLLNDGMKKTSKGDGTNPWYEPSQVARQRREVEDAVRELIQCSPQVVFSGRNARAAVGADTIVEIPATALGAAFARSMLSDPGSDLAENAAEKLAFTVVQLRGIGLAGKDGPCLFIPAKANPQESRLAWCSIHYCAG